MGNKNKTKLVCGVGVNDADYVVQEKKSVGYTPDGRRKRETVWVCPFYSTWRSMLARCYRTSENRPTYVGCTVSEEWKTFSNFKYWMESQDWQGKQLDKDLLSHGNKLYSPDTCVFVDRRVNIFLTERHHGRGEYPIGVCWYKRDKKFRARVNDGTGTSIYLGLFDSAQQAHEEWLAAKLKIAKRLASEIISDGGDVRIADALVRRYENYEKS